jgi:predicted MPP superfamily phosphohydrolase
MILSASLLAAALALYAGWIEPRSLRIRRFTLPLPGLAAPLRAAVIGDLQPYRHHWPASRLAAAFDRAAAHRPDIVFWLGDYYNAPTGGLARLLDRAPSARRLYDAACTPMADIAAAMARLKAPMGAYAVLGNHDWAWSGEACAAALREAGITPLIGEAAEAVHPQSGARLTVIGLDDASSGRPTGWPRLAARAAAPAILLTHAPDVWLALDGRPALTLAGHGHGGQIAPPPIGPTRLPRGARNFPRGWFERDGDRLYVTTGVGTSGPPLRLGAPPEIVLLDLTPAPAPG